MLCHQMSNPTQGSSYFHPKVRPSSPISISPENTSPSHDRFKFLHTNPTLPTPAICLAQHSPQQILANILFQFPCHTLQMTQSNRPRCTMCKQPVRFHDLLSLLSLSRIFIFISLVFRPHPVPHMQRRKLEKVRVRHVPLILRVECLKCFGHVLGRDADSQRD